MNGRLSNRPGHLRQDSSESEQQKRGRQSESKESRKRARPAGAKQAEAEPKLAACRPWQELAKGKELAEVIVVEPLASGDDLVPEVRKMGDGAPEGGQSELQERSEDLAYAAPSLVAAIGVCVQMPSLHYRNTI